MVQSLDQRQKSEMFGPAKDAALGLRKSESENRREVGVVGVADDALLEAAQGFAGLGGEEPQSDRLGLGLQRGDGKEGV